MTERTAIAWADSTFNPWIGCQRVGPGCEGCYAEALMDKRMGMVKWGGPRKRTSPAYWRQPLAWNRKAAESGKPWRVFCGSLCDIFDNEVPQDWRVDLWELIDKTPNLTWMLLTKRIGNASGMVPSAYRVGTWPWPHVWLGATVVNQEEADRDIPKLLRVPAAVRFLSIEPMLGPIDLRRACEGFRRKDRDGVECCGVTRLLDWVIVGGESDQAGHPARPFDIAWARDIVRQCKAAGVACFVKQFGSAPERQEGCGDCDPCIAGQRCPIGYNVGMGLLDRAGADPAEWPADLRVRQFPRGTK